jgi:ribonuclease T1
VPRPTRRRSFGRRLLDPRTRRPLIALIVLLVILAVGYIVQATHHNGGGGGGPSNAPASVAAPSAGLGSPGAPSVAARPSAPATGSALPSTINGLRVVALSGLPVQARQTVALVRVGGPFPYDRDGIVFNNNERRLPRQASGYYHEYTVPTPGESDRGARRIITGKGGEYYYTADHYETFVRVDLNR